MSFSNYGELCTEVYHLTKGTGQSLSGDIEYYTHRLIYCKDRILEAMVGSGRVMIPLLEAGLTVDGVDYSPEMLTVCRAKCEERNLFPVLYESNLQSLTLPHRYEAIIIPAGSFLLIENREESMNVLQRLYDHLQPGGRLILDIFLPDNLFGRFGEISTFSLPNGDIITMEGKLVEEDLYHQYKVSYLRYEKWRNGELIQTELQRLAVRWYGIEEFKFILAHIGFSDIVVSADYVYGQKPTHGKHTFVFEAVKR
jgi:SAM-dependent methyltransferase